jgi:hypothetical protein
MEENKMSQIEYSLSHPKDLLKFIDFADKDHIEFSKFVRDAEIFCQNSRGDAGVDEDLVQYRKIWFDLEVINALALDDWESSGMPENWNAQWDEMYRRDAQEVIAELRTLLASR